MKVFVIALLVIFAFGAYFTVFKVKDGEYGILLDRESGEIQSVFGPGYNFVPRNIAFWKHSVMYGRIRGSVIFDVRVPLPGLADVESRHYAVDMKVQGKYELDLENVRDDILLSKDSLVAFLKSMCRDSFEAEMLPFLSPVYDSKKLELNAEGVIARGLDTVKKRIGAMGVKLSDASLVSPLRIPSIEIYHEGLALAADFRKIENDSKKEQMLLENKLKKDEIEQKKYLENLREIAKVVKNNHDLLKYLYITGFSKNVNTIITPDRTGMPFGLDFSEKGSAPKVRGDVDNLR